MEHAGFGCPLETANLQRGGDVDLEDMEKLVEVLADDHAGKLLPFKEIVPLANSHGLFQRIFEGREEYDRSVSAALSRVFFRFDMKIFKPNRLRFISQGKGKNRKYGTENA